MSPTFRNKDLEVYNISQVAHKILETYHKNYFGQTSPTVQLPPMSPLPEQSSLLAF